MESMAVHNTHVNALTVTRADDRRGDASPGLAETYGREQIWLVVGDAPTTTSYDRLVRRSDTTALRRSERQ
jgi:hypothetical protein